MSDILTRAGCFVAIILLGWGLRRIGFFKKEDFVLLSKIVVRITLTAAIISNFAGRELEYSMLTLAVIGFAFGPLNMLIAWWLNKSHGREAQAFGVLNCAGCNIGNFALPFAQSFLGPVGVMAVSLFDVGNSFICLGGAYGAAIMVKENKGGLDVKPMLKALCRSVPLITYLVMTILSALRIGLPAPVVELAGIIGNANAFLAMLMMGVGFELSADPAQLGAVARILIPRFALGITLAVLSFRFLPFPLEYRQALAIVFLAPVASAAPAFTAEMGGDYGLASAVNSIAILISICLIVGALLIVL